jgi:hypothetical protein
MLRRQLSCHAMVTSELEVAVSVPSNNSTNQDIKTVWLFNGIAVSRFRV